MAWDLAGPVRTGGGLSDQIVCDPAPQLEACFPLPVAEPEAKSLLFPPLPPLFPPSPPLDLSPLVGELARLTIVLHQLRDDHRLQTEMLQEALLPWYKRLLRWMQSIPWLG